MKIHTLLITTAGVLLLNGTMISQAIASESQPIVFSDAPHVAEVLDILFPQKKRTRSLQISKSTTQTVAPKAKETVVHPTAESSGIVAMKISYEFDSDQLLEEAFPMLDTIAAVINHERSDNKTLVVEGHTDSVGSEDYNLNLSLRRAASVFKYLTTTHNIEPERIQIQGFGERAPLNSIDPTDELNRRVQFKVFN